MAYGRGGDHRRKGYYTHRGKVLLKKENRHNLKTLKKRRVTS